MSEQASIPLLALASLLTLSACTEVTICPYEIDPNSNPGWYEDVKQKCITAFGSKVQERNGSALFVWWNECRGLLKGSLTTLSLRDVGKAYGVGDAINRLLGNALGRSEKEITFLAAYRIDSALLKRNLGEEPVSVEIKSTRFTRTPLKEREKYLAVGRSTWLKVNRSYSYNHSTIRLEALRNHLAVDKWTTFPRGMCCLYRLTGNNVNEVEYRACDDKALWSAIALCESDRTLKCDGLEKDLQNQRKSFPSAQCSRCYAGGNGPFCLPDEAANGSIPTNARDGKDGQAECGNKTCGKDELCEKESQTDAWRCRRTLNKGSFPRNKRDHNPCYAGTLAEDGKSCVCLPNVTGLRCQHPDISLCKQRKTNPCKTSHGYCETAVDRKTGVYARCKCDAGFTGKGCDEDVNECESGAHKCALRAKCVNTFGSYTCVCPEGSIGPTCNKIIAQPQEGKDEGRKFKLLALGLSGIIGGIVVIFGVAYQVYLRARMRKIQKARESMTKTATTSGTGEKGSKIQAKPVASRQSK